MPENYFSELEFAISCCHKGAKIALSYYGRLTNYNIKSDDSIVTQADKECEELIRKEISTTYPQDGIIGEEKSNTSGQSGRAWVIDPIDGTSNFASGLPFWCISFALWEKGRPVVGVIYDPVREECYAARLGAPATLNNKEIKVSSGKASPLTTVCCQTSFHGIPTPEWNNKILSKYKMRCLGSAALQLALVASGSLDATYGVNAKIWDVAAGWLLVEAAGGKLTDLTGKTLLPFQEDPFTLSTKPLSYLGANSSINQTLLDEIFLG